MQFLRRHGIDGWDDVLGIVLAGLLLALPFILWALGVL